MAQKTISVIGALNYDLIMIANRIPDGGESLQANDYAEALGGKGGNAAIATFRTCHKRPKAAHGVAILDTPAEGAQENVVEPQPPSPEATQEELAIDVRMIGAVGDDRYGERFKTELKQSGVDISGVITVENTQSSICFVLVENYTRENRCLFTLGAMAVWTKEHFQTPEQLGNGVRPDLCVAQMEIHKEIVEQMIETAGRAGIEFVLNAAPASPVTRSTYQWITHLLVNETEAAIMSGRDLSEVNKDTWDTICQEFLNRKVKNVVLTLGAKGAYYANANQRGHCPAYKVDVVDTTGAGDTFTGTYASEYLLQKEFSKGADWDIEKAVIRANKAAAITIMRLGAQSGIPWSDEIDAFEAPFNDPDPSGLRMETDRPAHDSKLEL